jgi:hypothetical protein
MNVETARPKVETEDVSWSNLASQKEACEQKSSQRRR